MAENDNHKMMQRNDIWHGYNVWTKVYIEEPVLRSK